MKSSDLVPPPPDSPNPHAALRRALAERVAMAHAALPDAAVDSGFMALVSGSVVEDLADALSDVDMSIVFEQLPPPEILRGACTAAGASPPRADQPQDQAPWFWTVGDFTQGSAVVAFQVEGVEVQIGYSTHAVLQAELDDLLLAHNPDTPNHKLAEGLAKAEPLAGAASAARLRAVQQRLAVFPPALGIAMMNHWLSQPMPWRLWTQIVHRDAELWGRELLVQACWQLLGTLAGLNQCWFTRFQLKRMHKLAARFQHCPPDLVPRLHAVLQAPLPRAVVQLHALEAEVLDLVAQHAPGVDLAAARARHGAFRPGAEPTPARTSLP